MKNDLPLGSLTAQLLGFYLFQMGKNWAWLELISAI